MDFIKKRKRSGMVLAGVVTAGTASGALVSAAPPVVGEEMFQNSGIAVSDVKSFFSSKLFWYAFLSVVGMVAIGFLIKYVYEDYKEKKEIKRQIDLNYINNSIRASEVSFKEKVEKLKPDKKKTIAKYRIKDMAKLTLDKFQKIKNEFETENYEALQKLDQEVSNLKENVEKFLNLAKKKLVKLKEKFDVLEKHPKLKKDNKTETDAAKKMLNFENYNFDIEKFMQSKGINPREKVDDIGKFKDLFRDYLAELDTREGLVTKFSVDTKNKHAGKAFREYHAVYVELCDGFSEFERYFDNSKIYYEESVLSLLREYYKNIEDLLKQRKELGGEPSGYEAADNSNNIIEEGINVEN